MNEVRMPDALAHALAAEAAWEAMDVRQHPYIKRRLLDEAYQAKQQLRLQYPQLEEWLFGRAWREEAKGQRLAELQRLLKEVIERERS